MLNQNQIRVLRDINRILIDTTNKSAQATEELTRKDFDRESCLELLDTYISSIEYKLDEIKEYRKGY